MSVSAPSRAEPNHRCTTGIRSILTLRAHRDFGLSQPKATPPYRLTIDPPFAIPPSDSSSPSCSRIGASHPIHHSFAGSHPRGARGSKTSGWCGFMSLRCGRAATGLARGGGGTASGRCSATHAWSSGSAGDRPPTTVHVPSNGGVGTTAGQALAGRHGAISVSLLGLDWDSHNKDEVWTSV